MLYVLRAAESTLRASAKKKKRKKTATSWKLNVQFFDSNKLLLLVCLFSLSSTIQCHFAMAKASWKKGERQTNGKNSIHFECCFVFSFRVSFAREMLLADRPSIFSCKKSNETWIIFTIFKTFQTMWKKENISFLPHYRVFSVFSLLLRFQHCFWSYWVRKCRQTTLAKEKKTEKKRRDEFTHRKKRSRSQNSW